MFHDQVLLAVPCYYLVPVTKLTLDPQSGISGAPGSLDLTGECDSCRLHVPT